MSLSDRKYHVHVAPSSERYPKGPIRKGDFKLGSLQVFKEENQNKEEVTRGRYTRIS